MISDPYAVIRRPIMTEKSHSIRKDRNQYTFEIHRSATKDDVKRAVEKLFNVKVAAVRTMNIKPRTKVFRRLRGKPGKTRGWKKAIITLAPGSPGIDVL
ncbi:MAG: 50S ribosomal protein L23 [Planctomycetota bacterium]|nr:50S ribosomal protein L23 [Planctomycetota bacterium]